jgi:excisionase family DNA binding protein
MKEFEKMRFYSTAELADKLQMNIQVIARKLQSGEIEGYKIGKDWRIEEDAIQKWLQRISNEFVMDPRQKVIGNFIKRGRLVQLPAQRKKRVYILEFLLEKFDANRTYDEAEVNDIIKQYYDDFCTVRREFIMEKMMTRKDGKYHRNSFYMNQPTTINPPADQSSDGDD